MISQLNSKTKQGLKGRKACRKLDDRRVAAAIRVAKYKHAVRKLGYDIP